MKNLELSEARVYSVKPERMLSCFSLLQPSLLLNLDKQGDGGALWLLPIDEDALSAVKFNISLT
jgi:hypothetical protein